MSFETELKELISKHSVKINKVHSFVNDNKVVDYVEFVYKEDDKFKYISLLVEDDEEMRVFS